MNLKYKNRKVKLEEIKKINDDIFNSRWLGTLHDVSIKALHNVSIELLLDDDDELFSTEFLQQLPEAVLQDINRAYYDAFISMGMKPETEAIPEDERQRIYNELEKLKSDEKYQLS